MYTFANGERERGIFVWLYSKPKAICFDEYLYTYTYINIIEVCYMCIICTTYLCVYNTFIHQEMKLTYEIIVYRYKHISKTIMWV